MGADAAGAVKLTRRIDGGVPAEDGAVLGRKQEDRGGGVLAVGDFKAAAGKVGVEDCSGGRAAGAGRIAGRRDAHDERLRRAGGVI